MPAPRTVWGIDIGQRALKALKLQNVDGQLQVDALDIIEHPKILTPDDEDRREVVQATLEQFLARNDLSEATIAVAVPGQTSFTRFVKLPPVEEKKIPDIVRFEAEQQIPFDIDDVVWRWQTFQDPDSPDVEVGLFAMKRENVDDALSQLSEVGLNVDIVQMAPLALYNFMVHDEQRAEDGATLLVDVGTDKTDLVVADKARIWTRTIQIGGNSFTEALVRTFKLSFAKAEKLKRTAATSKYARQIFQAMRPVFADLVQEIQRSIGYYTSLHRETRFAKVLGLGNGFRLPGLQKFLQQNLNLPVARLDNYNNLQASPAVNAPAFTENVQSLGVAYGLGLQGLGLAEVSTNLLPGEIAQQRLWTKKRPWFAAAAAALVLALAIPTWRSYQSRSALADPDNRQPLTAAQSIANRYRQMRSELSRIEQGSAQDIEAMEKWIDVFAKRAYWPEAMRALHESLDGAFPDQSRLTEYAAFRSLPAELRESIEKRAEAVRDPRDTRAAAEILEALPAESRKTFARTMLGTEPFRRAAERMAEGIRLDARAAAGERLLPNARQMHTKYQGQVPENLREAYTGDGRMEAALARWEQLRSGRSTLQSQLRAMPEPTPAEPAETREQRVTLRQALNDIEQDLAEARGAVVDRACAILLAEATVDQWSGVLAAYLPGNPMQDLPGKLARALSFGRTQRESRRVCFVEALDSRHYAEAEQAVQAVKQLAQPGETRGPTGRGPQAGGDQEAGAEAEGAAFLVEVILRTPLPLQQANDALSRNLGPSSKAAGQEADLFDVVEFRFAPITEGEQGEGPPSRRPWTGGRSETGRPEDALQAPDPLFPDEDTINDNRFRVSWVLSIK